MEKKSVFFASAPHAAPQPSSYYQAPHGRVVNLPVFLLSDLLCAGLHVAKEIKASDTGNVVVHYGHRNQVVFFFQASSRNAVSFEEQIMHVQGYFAYF